MNNIEIIYEYDKIMNRLADEVKSSNYKIQYFLDLLQIKRSFFYKKLKEKRFTSEEMIKLSKSLFPEEYNDYEVHIINKLIEKSKEEIKNNKGKDFELFLNEQKEKYGL
jgi:predicted DNA-binding transcriptional regulator AlpA